MEGVIEKCIAICGGIITKVLGVHWAILFIWVGLIFVDIVTGIMKAKLNKQPILSEKMTDGATRKLMPIMLVTSLYLFTIALDIAAGIDLGIAPNMFAMFYLIAEVKSIIENFQQAGVLIPEGLSSKLDRLFQTDNCKQK